MSLSLSLESLLARSAAFSPRYPVQNNTLRVLGRCIRDEELLRLAVGTRPIIHEKVWPLLVEFLQWKKTNGTSTEKHVYRDMDPSGLVDRLLSKRPLAFLNACDSYLLRNGRHGANDWDTVGTDKEFEGLIMEDYMTYDEIKLAALIQVSSPVVPINSGSRHNIGVSGPCVSEAVYAGAVGARFERRDPNPRMEWQEIIVSRDQNIAENGYGKFPSDPIKAGFSRIFAKFYDLEWFPSYDEYQAGVKNLRQQQSWLNEDVYRKRICISAETFLVEANDRGLECGRKAYVHVVGLGLGVWMHDPEIQRTAYLKAFQEALENCSLESVAVIDFSWIAHVDFPGSKLQHGEVFPGTDVEIRFSRRDPFEELRQGHKDKLVVAMHAWDGNAFPGNEYWLGHLSASGDPAAACCTQISELQNPYVNCEALSAENVYVASRAKGLISLKKFLAED